MSDMCTNCKTRQATVNWVADGGVLGYTHGMFTRWCDYCATEAQLEHARKMAALVPGLKQKLRDFLAAEEEHG